MRPLFLCKSSRLLAVTSVLPLSISFFSRLCLPEPPHISDAWLAGTLCLIPKNPVEYLSSQLAGPGGVQLSDLYTVIVSFLPTNDN